MGDMIERPLVKAVLALMRRKKHKVEIVKDSWNELEVRCVSCMGVFGLYDHSDSEMESYGIEFDPWLERRCDPDWTFGVVPTDHDATN